MTISSMFQNNNAPTASATPGTTSNSQTDSAAYNVVSDRILSGLKISPIYTGFRALITVSVDATTDVSESFDLLGSSNGTTWAMNQNSVQGLSGSANISFSIDSTGQIKYTTSSTSGFVKRVIRWVVQVI